MFAEGLFLKAPASKCQCGPQLKKLEEQLKATQEETRLRILKVQEQVTRRLDRMERKSRHQVSLWLAEMFWQRFRLSHNIPLWAVESVGRDKPGQSSYREEQLDVQDGAECSEDPSWGQNGSGMKTPEPGKKMKICFSCSWGRLSIVKRVTAQGWSHRQQWGRSWGGGVSPGWRGSQLKASIKNCCFLHRWNHLKQTWSQPLCCLETAAWCWRPPSAAWTPDLQTATQRKRRGGRTLRWRWTEIQVCP